jgi:hypothetical protein
MATAINPNNASSNDLVPSFKIFSMLIMLTIAVKVVFQYAYTEPAPNANGQHDLTSVSLLKDANTSFAKKQIGGYFKSYLMYYLTIFWTICLIITIVAITFVKYDSRKENCVMKMSFLNLFPLGVFLLILSWIVYQNTTFFAKINSGHVAETYITFDTATNVILLIMSGLIYAYMNQQMLCPEEGADSRSEAIARYGPWIAIFLGLVGMGCMGINEIILRSFSTDG